MMLVQTTVAAVVPYFERFLLSFPDVERWRRPRGDVLQAWEGLGYYRRARQLHAAGRAIVERTAGHSPTTARRSGPSGRGALHRRGDPLVRLRPTGADRRGEHPARSGALARLGGPETGVGHPGPALAGGRAARSRPGGGTVQPGVHGAGGVGLHPTGSPVPGLSRRREVPGRALGLQDALPVTRPKPPPVPVTEACALVVSEGRVLIVQRGAGGLWEGFWEFPTIHVAGADPAGRSFGEPVDLAEGVRRLTGVPVRLGRSCERSASA